MDFNSANFSQTYIAIDRRFIVHPHVREWIVFYNQELLAVLNYRTQNSADKAAHGCNAAGRIISIKYS